MCNTRLCSRSHECSMNSGLTFGRSYAQRPRQCPLAWHAQRRSSQCWFIARPVLIGEYFAFNRYIARNPLVFELVFAVWFPPVVHVCVLWLWRYCCFHICPIICCVVSDVWFRRMSCLVWPLHGSLSCYVPVFMCSYQLSLHM